MTIETNNFDFEVKVILGLLTIETNNFVFEFKVILGPDGDGAQIVLNDPHD